MFVSNLIMSNLTFICFDPCGMSPHSSSNTIQHHCLSSCPPAQNRHVKAMNDSMNESRVRVSPLQLRAQESQSCVRWELSPLCLVEPVRLSVNPVLLVFTVEKQVSQLQPDCVVAVSSCITTQMILCCLCPFFHIIMPLWVFG